MTISTWRTIITIIFICSSQLSAQKEDTLNTIDGQGRKQGYWKEDWIDTVFSESGELVAEKIGEVHGYFILGAKNGVWNWIYNNKIVARSVFYERGKLMTVVSCRSFSGKVLYPGNIKNGTGELVEYYPNGLIHKQGQLVDGKKNGKHTLFTIGNKIGLELEYHENVPSGWHTQYIDGKPFLGQLYIDGVQVPHAQRSYDNSKCPFINQIKFMRQIDSALCTISYFRNGEVESITYNKDDFPCGIWNYFNKKGKLVKSKDHGPCEKAVSTGSFDK